MSGEAMTARVVKGRVLCVLSSADHLTFEDGKTEPSGFFLNELCIPLMKLLDDGWAVDFANPQGIQAATDPVSMSLLWYMGASSTLKKHKDLLEKMKAESNFASPLRLSEITEADLDKYAGVFIPGGHAPLEDLHSNPDLGRILKHFHRHMKPTGALCHGTIALVSTGDPADHTIRFIYATYRMTGYSNAEERFNELKWMHKLKMHVQDELEKHGGLFRSGLMPGMSHIEQDRELITGQNPASSTAFADAFLKKLNESIVKPRTASIVATNPIAIRPEMVADVA